MTSLSCYQTVLLALKDFSLLSESFLQTLKSLGKDSTVDVRIRTSRFLGILVGELLITSPSSDTVLTIMLQKNSLAYHIRCTRLYVSLPKTCQQILRTTSKRLPSHYCRIPYHRKTAATVRQSKLQSSPPFSHDRLQADQAPSAHPERIMAPVISRPTFCNRSTQSSW